MSEEALMKRINRAKKAAIESLVKIGYKYIPSDNSNFCFLAVRKTEIRMIRVVIDEITDSDIKAVQDFEPPGTCTKEIWCRREGMKDFEIREVN